MRTCLPSNGAPALALLLLAAPGCWSPSLRPSGQAPKERSGALPHPTKDEVVRVDGRPLSISGFEALRRQLKHPSAESVLWIATAAMAIQNETRSRGQELPAAIAGDIARYALGELSAAEAEPSLRRLFASGATLPSPQQAKQRIEALLSRAVVQRNEALFSSLKQP